MKRQLNLSIVLICATLIILFVGSCSTSSTVITGKWEKPMIEQNYNDILVAALVPTISSRSVIEQHMVEDLKEEGVNATQSIDRLPPQLIENEDTKQQIINSIRGDGVDAILTVSLIDKDTETRFVPGSEPYSPYPYYSFYGNFWGYYDYWYPRFYDSGYYTEDKIYYIETNLYDAKSEELIWSAQSETYNPVDIVTFSSEFAHEIVREMKNEGII